MQLSDEFMTSLRMANPIDRVMQSYVNIIRKGHNFVCSCPFHSEKTPSCTIYPDTQSFYCFGCGVGGDVVTFIKKIENLEYMEAVRFLAERANIPMPVFSSSEDEEFQRRKSAIFAINREAAIFFYQNLCSGDSSKHARKYLMQRRISPQTVKKYGLGFAPDSWDSLTNHLIAKGFRTEDMVASKVCMVARNGNIIDIFRNRLMFPIRDLRKNIVAFGGRVFDDSTPKYLNSPETPVFKKSRNLFSLNFAKKSDSDFLILAEGYMDVISLNQAGFENAVATLGTSITDEQARIISQYVKQVIIAYDSDNAGQKATQRALNLLSNVGVSARILKIEGAKDPDEYIKKFGAKSFRQLLGKAQNARNFEIAKCIQGLDLSTEQGRVDGLRKCVRVLADIPDILEREIYIGKVAEIFKVKSDIITMSVNEENRKKINYEKKQKWIAVSRPSKIPDNINPEASKYPKENNAEECLIAYLLKYPERFPEISSKISPQDFATSLNRKFFTVLGEKLKNNFDFSLSFLSNELNDAEMSRITGIDAKYKDTHLTPKGADDCIEILHRWAENQKIPDSLSDEDLRVLVDRKRGIS